MITFFRQPEQSTYYVVETTEALSPLFFDRLTWLFGGAKPLAETTLSGSFIGTRRELVTPWSTNAVEIVRNMGIDSVVRIEEFEAVSSSDAPFDPMLQHRYEGLDQQVFATDFTAQPILSVTDIRAYNKEQGLALSEEEITYLEDLSKRLGRPLTDSELFGFSQVNSEHCRHKIFGGTFIIDGQEEERSLFGMIKDTSAANPGHLVSAYKDNVAFIDGPSDLEQFAPASGDKPDFFVRKPIDSVLSLKAETHNFPTTVEPFNGAATGTGGEIRDRMAGGRASIPLAGTAVYMTSYPRTEAGRSWEKHTAERPWLYQTPQQILTKASNGASDFGNKFGQPLICGSLLTFEQGASAEDPNAYGFDKVIMLAGGVGYARRSDAQKGTPEPAEKVVLLGGDNYRIGMGGGAVSSVNTGQYAGAIELNAVQRSNPEMQKRVENVIRTLSEGEDNPIISIHDHGAGGHLNCLSELVETTGGHFDLGAFPIGDETLSSKEIIGNESQERMGLLVREEAIQRIARIAERERAPMYVVGETTSDMHLTFEEPSGAKPIDLALSDMFGSAPKTIMEDKHMDRNRLPLSYATDAQAIEGYLDAVLQLEGVACKDWLTNKADRSVTGRVARQQCQGEIQLPLSDCGAVAVDFRDRKGMATSIGHAPAVALVDPVAGSQIAIAEALTNIALAPLTYGLDGVSLSANWMWPCRQPGEDARLYDAVEAASDLAISLGINIPTGKDSLSMTQKYPEGKQVLSPGTVIISAVAEVSDVRSIVSPVLRPEPSYPVYHIDFSFAPLALGGSALAQVLGQVGNETPAIEEPEYFREAFTAVQELIERGVLVAGHDISSGGLITALLEMCFPNRQGGLEVDLGAFPAGDLTKLLFAENPGLLVQTNDPAQLEEVLRASSIGFARIATPTKDGRTLTLRQGKQTLSLDIDAKRDLWYRSSYLLDQYQSGEVLAKERFTNYKHQPLRYAFPADFTGKLKDLGLDPDRTNPSRVKAAILRDKGTNGEREMAYALWLAGFDVKDVHLTDLTSGRETLDDIQFIVFCGGFSNSDVLGSAKGWAAGILFNEQAKATLDRFYARPNTLSLGICNGCQLMAELELLYPDHELKHKMLHNDSHKFESGFVTLTIPENHSVMLEDLAGTELGVWVAHGEGKFGLPYSTDRYHVIARYAYDAYPANPNGSPDAVAGLSSADGRHLAMMPHPERAIFPWQCAHYPEGLRSEHEVTPWMRAFRNAFLWCADHQA